MRKLSTYEGVVENGHVRLLESVRIPEKTRVYVFVPDAKTDQAAYIASPRLADPEQSKDFEKQVLEEATDAGL
jgi:hypothetical protein